MSENYKPEEFYKVTPYLILTFDSFNYINEIRSKQRNQYNNIINSNVSKCSHTIE